MIDGFQSSLLVSAFRCPKNPLWEEYEYFGAIKGKCTGALNTGIRCFINTPEVHGVHVATWCTNYMYSNLSTKRMYCKIIIV